MDVPVIILNWNGWDDTLDCVRRLCDLPEAGEIWLVDNASNQDRTAEVQAVCPGLRVFRWDDNYGWAGGNNRALKIAAAEGHEFAYLLNNDCEPSPGFLSAVTDAAAADPKLAAVGSCILYQEPAGFARFDGEYHDPGARAWKPASGFRVVPNVNGAGMLVRLQAMEEAGYFDERYFCYAEETEWCWRTAAHGYRCAICLESVVLHACEGSDVSSNALYYRRRNDFLLMEYAPLEERAARRDRCILGTVLGAKQALRERDPERWLALSAALHDGLAGRFHRRPPAPSRAQLKAFMAYWTLRAYTRRAPSYMREAWRRRWRQ